jgi:nitrite reductase/ring-hydroxylating ferredoxin subunit
MRRARVSEDGRPTSPPGTEVAGAGGQPERQPERICASSELAERGRGVVFDILERGRPARAFVLRVDGTVVGYLNRCAHVPAEMDWQEGEFLDAERRFIVCSIHGASYEPATGRCAGGPCGRGRLQALRVIEAGGEVGWYPDDVLRPLSFDA